MLLELTSAYGVFAAEGERHPPEALLRVTDKDGKTLESFEGRGARVLEKEIAQIVTDILADNKARAPAFSATSPLYFPGRAVAAKTGTTNDFRDAWIVGYTPSIVVGAWAGNNDNRPMKKIAAFIVAPLWHEFMQAALKTIPKEDFTKPPERDLSALPPILRGIWQGGRTYFVDKLSGKRATEFTPPELREERAIREVHSTLYWIDKDAPLAPRTTPPESDPQFTHWEYAVRKWAAEQNLTDQTEADIPTVIDDIHTPEFAPKLAFLEPASGAVFSRAAKIVPRITASSHFPITKVNFFVNNLFVGSATKAPFTVSVSLSDLDNLAEQNELKTVAYDVVQNRGEATVQFKVSVSVDN
jgi:membrane peptidoglycan carboxypeptidase